MALVPRQGCWLSKAKVQSNGKNARPHLRRAMAHGTAFRFFLGMEKNQSLKKTAARMLISIWKEKSISLKRRQNVEGCGFVSMGELWKGFFPLNDGGIYVATWVWNAKYLLLVEEWEQLYFKKSMESMCFSFYYLDVPTFCCWKLCRMLMQPPA